MLLSELIKELQKLKEQHGDIPVYKRVEEYDGFMREEPSPVHCWYGGEVHI